MYFCSECERPVGPVGDESCPEHLEAVTQFEPDEPEEFIRDAEGAWVPGHVAPPPNPIRDLDKARAQITSLQALAQRADDKLAQFQNVAQGYHALTFRELSVARQLIDDARAILTKAQETL